MKPRWLQRPAAMIEGGMRSVVYQPSRLRLTGIHRGPDHISALHCRPILQQNQGMAFDEKLAQRVRSVLSDRTDVQEQKMMGKLAFMVDGSMCCSVGVEGILIRVDPRERSKLLARPHVTEMKLGKRIMKGFVRIGPEACRTKRALTRWIERGIASGAV